MTDDDNIIFAVLTGILLMLLVFLLVVIGIAIFGGANGDSFERSCDAKGGIVADHEHGKGQHDYYCIKGDRVVLKAT